MKKIFLIFLVLPLFSCNNSAKIREKFNSDRSKFYQDFSQERIASHRSILIIPPINNSANVKASGDFLSAIAFPIAERGYYTFPVNLTKKIMEDEGMSDVNLVHSQKPQILAELFGADAVLYTTIDQWDAKYIGLSTLITVKMTYILKSGRDGSILWKDVGSAVYDSNQDLGNSSGLAELFIKMIINALLSKVSEEGRYFALVQSANNGSLASGPSHLPSGAYLIEYERKQESERQENEGLKKKKDKKVDK